MSAHPTPVLVRHAYLPSCTLGWLHLGGGEKLATIERPWQPGDHPGGLPSESCVPEGLYLLGRHSSDKFPDVFALTAPDLGVWYQPADRPEGWGRYGILIHLGNFVRNVQGCIAVGMSHTIITGQQAVDKSQAAMAILRDCWSDLPFSLVIRATRGTEEAWQGRLASASDQNQEV